MNTTLGMKKTLTDTDFQGAYDKVVDALKAHGFGVVTEIDLRATFAEKLGVEFGPYVILGACNPAIAHQALQRDPDVGMLLPCNVVLRQVENGVEVAMVDPTALSEIVPDAKVLEPLMHDARKRFEGALEEL